MPEQTILLVDDDRDLLQSLTIMLKAAGYNVLTAEDSIRAISETRLRQPDLIILDIGLPGGDGFMILERLRAMRLLANLPIIILSAQDPKIHRDRALSAGAIAFLEKPAEKQQLLAAIRQALGDPSTSATDGRPPAHKTEGTETKTILVVDDDPDVLRALSVRLRANGYDVIVASDAVNAISKARKDGPDLIVLDIGLPGGDGFRIMERLKNMAQTATIPVIVISGQEPSLNRERAIRIGAKAYLQKPVDSLGLLAEIRKVLGELYGIEGWGGDEIGSRK
jgi:DNA-binding response OmpR family regulator